jgi:hypothetical protein
MDCERRPAIRIESWIQETPSETRTATKQLEVSAMGIIVFFGI